VACPLLKNYFLRQKQFKHKERDYSKEGYIYIWADGIYFNIRSDDAKQCILAIIGVASRNNKGFLAIEGGYREADERQRNSV
jgi:transposase-like protein